MYHKNQHLLHICRSDPKLGNILVNFLKESDPKSFGALKDPQRLVNDAVKNNAKAFESSFSNIIDHIVTSDLVQTWSKQDTISNFKTLNSLLPNDDREGSQFIALDIEWVKQLLSYTQFLYNQESTDVSLQKIQKLLLAVIGLTTNYEILLAANWGILQCHILMKEWSQAWGVVSYMNELISSSKGEILSFSDVHLNREWLMVAALFVLSRHPEGPSALGAEFFMQSSQLNTILCGCQHLFRYLVSFLLMNKKRKSFMRDLVKFLGHDSVQSLDDPIVQLLVACLINYDFAPVRELLERCQQMIEHDYFLRPLENELMEGARTIVFETYCKFHRHISIASMSHMLYLDCGCKDEGEMWVVKVLQRSRIDAKIDSEQGTIIIQARHPVPYHHVIEKTKSQNLRTQMMSIHLESTSQAS